METANSVLIVKVIWFPRLINILRIHCEVSWLHIFKGLDSTVQPPHVLVVLPSIILIFGTVMMIL